jgi:hypothetical protein
MDYAYSPVQYINTQQRMMKPVKMTKSLKGKRLIKSDTNNEKINRTKQKNY